MPKASAPRRLALVALLCAATLTGCDEAKVLGPVIENEDSNFLEGKRLAGEGKDREALEAFTKVILSRHDAPESHLEAGNLCLDSSIKDPLQAIFHFRRHLALQPGTEQARGVEQRIRAAQKAYLATLPFAPSEVAGDDRAADLLGKLKLIRAENDLLKRKVTALETAAAKSAPALASHAAPDTGDEPETAPAPRVNETRATPPPSPAETARRTHTIARGDTLAGISRKYYGTPNKWSAIYNANRGVMRNERDLKIGVKLVIPE